MIGGGEPEGHVEVALLVELRAEGVLVVVAIAPGVREGLEAIGPAVPVGVGDPGELAALGDVEGLVPILQAEDLVEARGEELVGRLGALLVRTLDQPDVAAAGGHRDRVVGEDGEGSGLEDELLGDRQVGDGVVEPLPRLRAPGGAEVLGGQ